MRPVESLLMSKPEYLQLGGMAVPEGVMMRSPRYWAVACRAPNGELVVKTEPLESTWIGRQRWLKRPFLRGTLALLDTMGLGLKAMGWASNVQMEEKYHSAESLAKLGKRSSKGVEAFQIGVTIVLSLALGFAIFDASPEAIAQYLMAQFQFSNTVANYIAEIIKIALFIGYLVLIRKIPAVLDIFRYHGAEHKAINVVEAGKPLDIATCMATTRLHPRCGTNFAIVVLIVSFLVFPLIPRDFLVGPNAPHWLVVITRLGVKLAVLPLVAGISYEVIRMAARAQNQKWVNLLLKPGLATQLITTEEPTERQVEVGIASLKAVMLAEQSGQLTNTEMAAPEPVSSPAAG